MTGRPPSPPITISDPGNGRVVRSGDPLPGPRRSRRRLPTRWLVGPAVLVLSVGAAGLATNAHRSSTREAAAQLRAVQLTTAVEGDPRQRSADGVTIGLSNDGPDGLVLLSARLAAPGYRASTTELALARSATIGVGVPNTPACPGTTPTGLVVRVRTGHGDVAERTVPLGDDLRDLVRLSAAAACGTLADRPALQFAVTDTTPAGQRVLVDAAWGDDGHQPLTVTGLTPAPGLSVDDSVALPHALPPRNTGDGLVQEPVRFTVHVSDCEQFVASTRRQRASLLTVALSSAGRPLPSRVVSLSSDVVTLLGSCQGSEVRAP